MSTENKKKDTITEDNNLLKTGEFAKLARINRDTLSFYIKKDLIHPIFIGKNKYKYFSPEQVQTVSLIKYLRRCLIPIEEIKIILENPSYEIIHSHITEQKKYLSDQLNNLKEASDFLSDYIKERVFLNSKKVGTPFFQYCKEQKATVFPIRFCQAFKPGSGLQDVSGYLNELCRHMSYTPAVCIIPADVQNCTEYCRKARNQSVTNDTPVEETSDYRISLDEGLYAMIIGESCIEKLNDSLSLLQKKITSSGYRPAEKHLYVFVENSLLKVPAPAKQRYLLKMKIEKKEE